MAKQKFILRKKSPLGEDGFAHRPSHLTEAATTDRDRIEALLEAEANVAKNLKLHAGTDFRVTADIDYGKGLAVPLVSPNDEMSLSRLCVRHAELRRRVEERRVVHAARADIRVFVGSEALGDIGPDENISYRFNAGDLIRNNGTGDQVILRGVQNLTFTYFDVDGNELAAVPLSAANRTLVRFVGISIQGETDRGEPVTYTTRIALRNG